jgi:hypothetical protein
MQWGGVGGGGGRVSHVIGIVQDGQRQVLHWGLVAMQKVTDEGAVLERVYVLPLQRHAARAQPPALHGALVVLHMWVAGVRTCPSAPDLYTSPQSSVCCRPEAYGGAGLVGEAPT